MHRRPLDPKSILFGVFWTVIAFLALDSFVAPWIFSSTLDPHLQTFEQAHRTLHRNSLEPMDSLALTRHAAAGMLESLEDPYASFVGPEELRRFREDSSGTLVGIGVMLNPRGTVLYPQPNGKAEAAGLRPGDRFLRIDGEDVSEWLMPQLSERLRGELDTEVDLEMARSDGTTYRTLLPRSQVPTLTVGDARVVDAQNGIAHIHIRSFAGTTAREFEKAMWRMDSALDDGLRGLVLDLRWNIGGQLDSALDIASMFLDGDLICSLENRDSTVARRYADLGKAEYADLPIVLLVNEWSASGSEVLAAALRERGMGVLVGQRTYGKGIYQQVYSFEQAEFVLKFTAGYYITAAGRILEGHLDPDLSGGLTPDVAVNRVAEQEGAIRSWLRRNPPPSRYRDRVHELFPEIGQVTPPADDSLDVAVELLARSLIESA